MYNKICCLNSARVRSVRALCRRLKLLLGAGAESAALTADGNLSRRRKFVYSLHFCETLQRAAELKKSFELLFLLVICQPGCVLWLTGSKCKCHSDNFRRLIRAICPSHDLTFNIYAMIFFPMDRFQRFLYKKNRSLPNPTLMTRRISAYALLILCRRKVTQFPHLDGIIS